MKTIYLVGSLRNDQIPIIANKLRTELGYEIFDDWYAPGRDTDAYWKAYEEGRGRTYKEALEGHAAKHIFEFDKYHLDRVDAGILVMPAGRSGHLELGYLSGQGKPTFIVFPGNYKECASLPSGWEWLSGLYEGEGSITRNKNVNGHSMHLSITSTDKDVVERAYTVSGVGHLQGPYKNKGSNLISSKKKGWTAKEQWRWAVYKKDDIYYVIKGMWNNLGERRRKQIMKTFTEANMNEHFIWDNKTPYEFRWDVMNQFAKTHFNLDELITDVKGTV